MDANGPEENGPEENGPEENGPEENGPESAGPADSWSAVLAAVGQRIAEADAARVRSVLGREPAIDTPAAGPAIDAPPAGLVALLAVDADGLEDPFTLKGVTVAGLEALVEFVETCEARIAALREMRDSRLKLAAEVGFAPRAVKAIVRRRALAPDGWRTDRAREAMLKAYALALGEPPPLTAGAAVTGLAAAAEIAIERVGAAARATARSSALSRRLMAQAVLAALRGEPAPGDADGAGR